MIEIIVAISIVALLAAIAIPNLRNFSKQQEIDLVASQIVNTLKTAQSSASSRIRCPGPDGQVSEAWKVRFTASNYLLIAQCKASADQTVTTKFYSPSQNDTTAIFQGSLDDCSGLSLGLPTDIIFSGTQTGYLNPGFTIPRIGTVCLTLTNTSGTLTKVVRIEQGGVIKIE